jgi:hypothetical protein
MRWQATPEAEGRVLFKSFGKRMVGGWRLENLPWTYGMNQKLIYQRDLKGQ